MIAFKMDGHTVYCAAVYFDINLTVRLQKFIKLLEIWDSKRIPLIVGVDSNAHSVLWGCEETNKRGKISRTSFCVLTLMRLIVVGKEDGSCLVCTLIESLFLPEKYPLIDSFTLR